VLKVNEVAFTTQDLLDAFDDFCMIKVQVNQDGHVQV
jgi:hypothetical protein